MELTPLSGRPADWDQRIAPFDGKSLFHESVWLDFMRSIDPRARIDYYCISDHGEPVGYFCAILKRRYSFWLCESPLLGRKMYWTPIVNRDVDPAALADSFLGLERRGIASLELCHEPFSPAMMRERGFEASSIATHWCPLTGGTDAIWARMQGTCRTRIRKAEKSGLVAEVTDDPAFVEHISRFLTNVRSGEASPGPRAPDRSQN